MNDSNISCFLSLARTKDLNLTAEKLYSTPRSILRNVQKVEDDLGIRLFHDDYQDIRLTKAGEKFYSLFSALEQDLVAAKYYFSKNTAEKTLCIGWCDWTGRPEWILDAIKSFIAKHPEIQVCTRLSSSQKMLDFIDEGSVDVAIMSKYSARGIRQFSIDIPLCELPLYLIIGECSRFEYFEMSSPQMLAVPHFSVAAWETSDSMVSQCIDSVYMRLGLGPRLTYVLPNWTTVYTEVHMGNGVTISPRNEHLQKYSGFIYKDIPISATLAAVRLQKNKNPAISLFTDHLLSCKEACE